MLKKNILLLIILLTAPFLLTAQKKKPGTTPKKDAYKEYQKQFSFTDDPAPVKYIKPYLDTSKYIPKHFYIAEINDSTGSNDSVGFTLQPKSGKKQRLAFEGGLQSAFTISVDKKLTKDSTLYPLIFNIRKFSITEIREKPYDNASFNYQYEFLYRYKNKLEKITGYSGRGYMLTPVGMKKKYDSLLNASLERQFTAVDETMAEGIEKSPMFCKGVKLTVTMRQDDGAPANDTIFFDTNRELTWADFKSDARGAENTFASYIGLSFDPDEITYTNAFYNINVNIGASFIKSASWIGKAVKEQAVLYHMRYRLKLAAVYALKLKKRLQATTFTCDNFNGELRTAYTDVYKDLNVAMDKFDHETKYGQNKKDELRWEQSIETQLDEVQQHK